MKVKFAQILVKEKLVESARKETDVPIKFNLTGKDCTPQTPWHTLIWKFIKILIENSRLAM